MRFNLLVSMMALVAVSGVCAQEPPAPVEEAQAAAAAPPVAEAPDPLAPSTGDELALTYDQMYTPKESHSIKEELSVDLIDLNALREAIDKQAATEKLRMSLNDCIQMALKQNQDIIVATFGPEKAAADIFSAKGEFDPAWQTKAQYVRASMIASQQIRKFGNLTTIETWQTTVDSTVAGKLHTGTQYALALNMSKEEGTYGGFIEEFEGQFGLTLTQPLLNGFGFEVNEARIHIAEKAKQMSEAQVRLAVMNVVAEVVKAYWDLVGAFENLKVRGASLANAERLLNINETRQRIGTAADIEVLQAKAGVAGRQSELIAARSQVAAASDVLKRALDLRQGDYFSTALVVPTDRPNPDQAGAFDAKTSEDRLKTALENALKLRPEVEIADLQIDSSEIEAMRARNAMLPQFDLTGMYAQGGRNHKLRETVYGIRDGVNEFYSMGFQATVPLGNRAARGQYQKAELTKREMEVRKDKQIQDLELGVHMAMRSVATNQILVESNEQARRLQEANVVAEEKRLRLGMTTSWQTLKVQEDLTAAQTMELQAQIAYEKALVDLSLAEGTVLTNFGVEFTAPEDPKPVGYVESMTPHWK